MNKQSEHLRDQARRAMRLALTISDHQASTKLKDMARRFDCDAQMLEHSDDGHVSDSTPALHT